MNRLQMRFISTCVGRKGGHVIAFFSNIPSPTVALKSLLPQRLLTRKIIKGQLRISPTSSIVTISGATIKGKTGNGSTKLWNFKSYFILQATLFITVLIFFINFNEILQNNTNTSENMYLEVFQTGALFKNLDFLSLKFRCFI